MKIVKNIPNTITSMNLLCGVMGVIFALEGWFDMAFYLMLAGAVCDFCDGLAARLLKAYSDLGKELDSLAAFFLNFIENIGISLTSRSDNMTDATGIIHVLSVNAPAILLISRWAIVTNEPHIIAHAGVARPMKFSLCLSSMLNFASLNAENTTIMSGRKQYHSPG